MNIPKTLKVRIQKKTSVWNGAKRRYVVIESEIPLAFFTYVDEKGLLRKKKSWSHWGDSEHVDLLNEPKEGFTVCHVVKRSNDWFGTGRNVFRIVHPDNLVFEISANNFLELIKVCDVEKGLIKNLCVLAWDGANMSLIPTVAPIYKDYAKSTEKINAGTLSLSKLQIGKVYVNRRGEEMTYMGKHWVMTRYSKLEALKSKGFFPWSQQTTHQTHVTFTYRQAHVMMEYVKNHLKGYLMKVQIGPSLYDSSNVSTDVSTDVTSENALDMCNENLKKQHWTELGNNFIIKFQKDRPTDSEMEYIRNDVLRLAEENIGKSWNDSNELYKKYQFALNENKHYKYEIGNIEFVINDK